VRGTELVLSRGKLQMLNIRGIDLKTHFLLKFGSGFYEKEEGEVWGL
jgi:hypothetical protein